MVKFSWNIIRLLSFFTGYSFCATSNLHLALSGNAVFLNKCNIQWIKILFYFRSFNSWNRTGYKSLKIIEINIYDSYTCLFYVMWSFESWHFLKHFSCKSCKQLSRWINFLFHLTFDSVSRVSKIFSYFYRFWVGKTLQILYPGSPIANRSCFHPFQCAEFYIFMHKLL